MPSSFSLGDAEGGVANQLRAKPKIRGETPGPY